MEKIKLLINNYIQAKDEVQTSITKNCLLDNLLDLIDKTKDDEYGYTLTLLRDAINWSNHTNNLKEITIKVLNREVFYDEAARLLTKYEYNFQPMQNKTKDCISILDPAYINLWNAINKYTEACNGDTSDKTVSNARMQAVVDVDKCIEALLLRISNENS